MIAVLLRQQEKEQNNVTQGVPQSMIAFLLRQQEKEQKQCNPGSATINDRRSAPAARERAETM